MRLLRILALMALSTMLYAPAFAAELPEGVQWETNNDDPPIGDPAAIKGGTIVDYLPGFPMTFRLYGPNSNEYFANFSRPTSIDIGLVMRHPTTDNFIPVLATHWAIMDDHKTVYYKLDPEARWSDGEPITADDYTFAFKTLQSPLIRDPAVNQAMEDYFESLEKIDDHTIKVVGKNESWRPLEDYNFTPLPEHAMNVDEEWVDRDNYTPPVVQGPYTISEFEAGKKVVFSRNANWWGYKKHYFQGVFNVDRIELTMINDVERAFDFFKKGELSMYLVTSARMWATQMEFDELAKGWVHRKKVYNEEPQGMSGITLNMMDPVMANKDFRKALQYLFNFEELNEKLMYNAYFRKVSAFEGTEYANPDLKPYGYQPKEGVKHLRAAGYTKRGSDGILTTEDGQRASFTMLYGSKSLERHLTVIQNTYKRAGIEMKLQLVEPVAYFEKLRENAYQAAMISMVGGFYPAPHQYFASEFKGIPQTNNFWNFGTEETDKLIDTYRFSMDAQERKEAMHELDRIIQDEAFYIPFWSAPYTRFLYWHGMEWPEFLIPKRAQSFWEYQVFWINPDKQKKLREAQANGQSLGADPVVEVDPYGVLERLEAEESK